MPKLDTTLHLEMLHGGQRRHRLAARVKQAVRLVLGTNIVYGVEWGDPESVEPLRYVRGHFLKRYVTPETTVLEIGPGGGRWTRYMLEAKQLYVVDYHQEMLDELRSNFNRRNMTFIKNSGDDFPGVPDASIDFLFSFGAFVHLDLEIIDGYLRNIRRVLAPNATAVIHYSDKTKPLGKRNGGFSENDPDTMRNLVLSHGYSIHEEDVGTMWHSSIIRFGLSPRDG
jgi:SAM-dependent methyltransferase